MKLVGNTIAMKQLNIDIVRKALKKEQCSTKQKLSEITGLSVVTINSALKYLIEKKEVFEDTFVPSNGGRPALQFRYNNDFCHILLLYAHQFHSKDVVYVCVANLLGESICEEEFILNEISVKNFEKIIENFIEKYIPISAIGFGLPAVEYEGIILSDDYNTIYGAHFIQHFKEKYQMPVLLENDVNAAVVGYFYLNKLNSSRCIVYLYFPQKYPPGGGIFIDGKLYKGYANFAGEIKNIPLGIDWNAIDYDDFNKICDAIARLIVSIVSILNPEKIILSGDFFTSIHVQSIDKQCRESLLNIFMPQICISNHFNLDFKLGMIQSTLNLLQPK